MLHSRQSHRGRRGSRGRGIKSHATAYLYRPSSWVGGCVWRGFLALGTRCLQLWHRHRHRRRTVQQCLQKFPNCLASRKYIYQVFWWLSDFEANCYMLWRFVYLSSWLCFLLCRDMSRKDITIWCEYTIIYYIYYIIYTCIYCIHVLYICLQHQQLIVSSLFHTVLRSSSASYSSNSFI